MTNNFLKRLLGSLYIPTLLRELLLSESEGIVERTLYVEPAKKSDAVRLTAPTE